MPPRVDAVKTWLAGDRSAPIVWPDEPWSWRTPLWDGARARINAAIGAFVPNGTPADGEQDQAGDDVPNGTPPGRHLEAVSSSVRDSRQRRASREPSKPATLTRDAIRELYAGQGRTAAEADRVYERIHPRPWTVPQTAPPGRPERSTA